MRHRRLYIGLIIFLLVLTGISFTHVYSAEALEFGYEVNRIPDEWNQLLANRVNNREIFLEVNGKDIHMGKYKPFMNENMELMIPLESVPTIFRCTAGVYDKKNLVIEKNTISISADLDSDVVEIDGVIGQMDNSVIELGDQFYISLNFLVEGLQYNKQWLQAENTMVLTSKNPDAAALPVSYDYRKTGRNPLIKDQGPFGTCWAFAALTALESSLMPEEAFDFSEDNMTFNNNFMLSQDSGGEYSMSMAYLLAWQGPILEDEDSYGDGIVEKDLKPRKHVQEVQILPKKDYDKIKEAVYLYGGVQTSLYSQLTDSNSKSEFYNDNTFSYCYIGTEKINHDVVIVGWDDNYPKENFNVPLEGNGAFLCMNSWGESFGDKGYFWVSYYDTNIGIYNIVYTRVENPNNFDSIYQSDLCGWVGQIGYGEESAYFANVYKAKANETLSAVGFYATGPNTEYEVYVVPSFDGTQSLDFSNQVATGTLANTGYYTIDLDREIALAVGTEFAIIIYIRTPGSERPIAVEYSIGPDTPTAGVDINDGTGFISLKGTYWQETEEKQKCNLCLKAYTKEVNLE